MEYHPTDEQHGGLQTDNHRDHSETKRIQIPCTAVALVRDRIDPEPVEIKARPKSIRTNHHLMKKLNPSHPIAVPAVDQSCANTARAAIAAIAAIAANLVALRASLCISRERTPRTQTRQGPGRSPSLRPEDIGALLLDVDQTGTLAIPRSAFVLRAKRLRSLDLAAAS